ncbi:MAG: carboxyl-terminal processing protease [Actinomycetota bacterium]|nr:carboxyl-terminal processing protease [Actinomycetota bacterium]
MLSLLSPAALRRALRVSTVLALMALAYVGGVVTGVVGRDQPAPRRGVLDEAAARIADTAARPIDRKALDRAAVEGMLRALGDRWSTYYGAAEFSSFHDALEGQYSGVGLWLRSSTGGGVQVGSVQPGSPAARADLRAGDVLVSVGRKPVATIGMTRVATLLRGREHTSVGMVVRRGTVTRDLHLTRARFTTEDVVVEHLAGNIARIQVSAFTRGVGREVRDALGAPGERHAGGVVLDLRDDPGGLLDEAVQVASVFLDGGPVVSYERRGRPARTLDASSGGDLTTPLVVLVNSSTASAAEVVAAALQDRNRAVVVGSRTYGKGSVQEPARLSDGSALELTVGRYLTPAGRSLEGVGVEPDVAVEASAPSQESERRAVEVLTGLVAALGGTGRG